jgi:hypothetical protein
MPAGSVSGLAPARIRGRYDVGRRGAYDGFDPVALRSNLTIAINGDDRQYVMRTVDGRELDRSGSIATVAGQTYYVTASDR